MAVTEPKIKDRTITEKKSQRFIDCGLEVLAIEAAALEQLKSRLDENFSTACELILNCTGRIVVTGMGKSGHIGTKIAATLASTGSPAFFLHPAEALHGDFGMIMRGDVIIALSYSGETEEILKMLPCLKRLGSPLISLTGNPRSQIAQHSSIHLNVGIEKEACILGLAPTASTTAALAMGDALAISVLNARGFTAEDFARSHPGGKLGKKLLIKVADIMRVGDEIPRIAENASIKAAIIEISNKRLGMVIIEQQHSHGKIAGIFTDGDLRRILEQEIDIHNTLITEVMNTNFTTITQDLLAVEALRIMENCKINGFPVIDANTTLIGAFNMHDLLRAGVA